MAVGDAKPRIVLPPGAYPTDGHEINSFLPFPGRKINRYGLSFDGVDDYVLTHNTQSLEIPNNITVLAIINWPGNCPSGFYDTIIAKRNDFYGSGGIGFNLGVKCDGHINGGYRDKDGNYIGDVTTLSNTILETNKNYLITEVIKPIGIDIYINGELDKVNNCTITDISITTDAKIGVDMGRYGYIYIKLLVVYNTAKSDDFISAFYDYYFNNSSLPSDFFDGLVLFYDFTEKGSSKLYDKSGFSNHGQIYGATWLNEPQGKTMPFLPVVRV